MPGSERKAAAKEVDAVFSTAAVAETRGGGGEGGERRQRARGVGNNRVDGRLRSGDGGSVRTRRRDQWRETATSKPWGQQRTASKQKEAADDAGRGRRGDGGEEAVRQETGKEGAGGSASAASRRKQRRRKRPRSMAATASWEGGTGGLIKTETRPRATEKSEGREDKHVVGDEVCRGSSDSITEEKGGGVCGDGREGRKGDGRRWRKREEREKRQGTSPVEERERRDEKPGLTASRGRSGGRWQRSASKNGDAGARRDNGGREKCCCCCCSSSSSSLGTQGIRYVLSQPTSILLR